MKNITVEDILAALVVFADTDAGELFTDSVCQL